MTTASQRRGTAARPAPKEVAKPVRRRRGYPPLMKHLTVGSKDLLIGDEAADVLTRYAAVVAAQSLGDRVEFHAFGSDCDEVMVTIVLSPRATIVTETSHNALPEPDNADSIAYVRKRIELATSPPPVRAAPDDDVKAWESQFEDL